MEVLKDLVAKLQLLCSLETAIIQELEETRAELYRVTEDNKRISAVNRSLENRYSELMYAYGAFTKAQKDAFDREVEKRHAAELAAQEAFS